MLKNSIHYIFHKQGYFIRVDVNSDATGKEGSHLDGEDRVSG